MSRLFSYLSKHHGRKFICNRCLHSYSNEALLKDHVQYCSKFTAAKTVMPNNEEKYLEFKNYHKMLRAPIVIYADFECFLRPVHTCDNSPEISQTKEIQKHVPASFAYYKVRSDGSMCEEPYMYCGEGVSVIDHFFEQMIEEHQLICEELENIEPMILTAEQEELFANQVYCGICHRALGKDRVRHHDHLSGEFVTAAHNACNLQLSYRTSNGNQGKYKLPIFFHGLKNYDEHLLMQSLGKYADDGMNISVIPSNNERYITFSLGDLNFIDSFQFLASSLEKLAQNLETSDFVHLSELYPNDIDILRRKQVFCYDWFTGPEKLDAISLPPKDQFYSMLYEQDITDNDYAHAQNVWQHFGMQSFQEYHDLYLKTDVLILADVFEKFRNTSYANYSLDPAHFITLAQFSFDAMLFYTKAVIELIQDESMYMFFESAIRGGVCFIAQRHSQANNKDIEDYDPLSPSVYISLLDANNLYGYAMQKYLPQCNFEWVTDTIFLTSEFILNHPDDANIGYVLEVDLDYPASLHDKHSCYPMVAHQQKIEESMLSPHAEHLRELLNVQNLGPKKLLTTLYDKKKYIVHYTMLKLYIKHGLKLRTVHKAVKFVQSPWLSEYINFNTQKRQNASNAFEKYFYKIMNNSIYGKQLQSVRDKCQIKLVSEERSLSKLTSKPQFKGFTIFNKNLVSVDSYQTVVCLNRPVFSGFSILEISKRKMLSFHYDVMLPHFGDRIKLIFTDTDSFAYEIKSSDLTLEYAMIKEHMDFSNYPQDHPLYSTENKAVVGKFKCETNGKPIKEVVGLKPKMYSMLMAQNAIEFNKMTAKGISRRHVQKNFKHQMYVECLETQRNQTAEYCMIRSKNHNIFTYGVRKTSLGCFDTKRYLLGCGIYTLPYGHYAIEQHQND